MTSTSEEDTLEPTSTNHYLLTKEKWKTYIYMVYTDSKQVVLQVVRPALMLIVNKQTVKNKEIILSPIPPKSE